MASTFRNGGKIAELLLQATYKQQTTYRDGLEGSDEGREPPPRMHFDTRLKPFTRGQPKRRIALLVSQCPPDKYTSKGSSKPGKKLFAR